MWFFLMSQGSLNPKIRFLGQKACPAARPQTDTHTHTKVTTVGTLAGFQDFSFNLSSLEVHSANQIGAQLDGIYEKYNKY